MDWLADKQKIAEFIHLTGAGATIAKQQLKEHNWNVTEAVRSYKFLKNAMLPPIGPQKNAQQEKHLRRGLSKTVENEVIVNKARQIVWDDLAKDLTQGFIRHLQCTAEYSFCLPCTDSYTSELREHLHKELVDSCHITSLEQAGHLNWWTERDVAQRLWPLQTKGDGNCLLHAASLGMWGFHDRELLLRNALFTTVTNCTQDTAMYRRWRWEKTMDNKLTGLELTEKEWGKEWDELLRLSSPVPRSCEGNNSQSLPPTEPRVDQRCSMELYDSLEEFHVFVLAQILRRPIIVVSDVILKDSWGNAMSPVNFGGIYLPIECDPCTCIRSPLLLTYDASHFSALVKMETNEPDPLPCAIPLVDPELKLLRTHYVVDPGVDFIWGKDDGDDEKVASFSLSSKQKIDLLKKYMDICEYADPTSSNTKRPSTNVLQRSNSLNESNNNRYLSNSSDSRSNTLGSNAKEKFRQSLSADSKGKLKQQMHTISRSFNSLSRSVVKKVRKISHKDKHKKPLESIENNERLQENTGDNDVNSNESRRLECMPPSTVLCVDLKGKRLEYQDLMMNNYLSKLIQGFNTAEKLQMPDTISEEGYDNVDCGAGGEGQPCVNSACKNIGQVTTCNLCPTCYEALKRRTPMNSGSSNKAPLAKEEDSVQPMVSNDKDLAPPNLQTTVSNSPRLMTRQDTLVATGKSKFYTQADEVHSLQKNSNNADKNNSSAQTTAKMNNTALEYYKPTNAPGVAYELGQSSFYCESPLTNRSVSSSKGPSKEAVKPILVNNLQNEFVYHSKEEVKSASYKKPAPFQNDKAVLSKNADCQPNTKLVVKCPENFAKTSDTEQKKPSYLSDHKNKNLFHHDNLQRKCVEPSCSFYGTAATDFYCSACFKLKQKADEHALAIITNGTVTNSH